MKLGGIAAAAIAATVMTGCAASPETIEPQYVSETQYYALSCQDLTEEYGRLSARIVQVSDKQANAAAVDAVSTTVGMVVFWPALFVLAATDNHAPELGRLKGEYEALDRMNRKKQCGIEVVPLPTPAPPPPIVYK